MITTIVRFALPASATRSDVLAVYRDSTARYRDLPGLIRKYYLLDEDSRTAGAIYLWETRAAAEAIYNDEWRRSFLERYGAEPTVSYFETPVVVDNLTHEVIDTGEVA
jgi:hypothetical protein